MTFLNVLIDIFLPAAGDGLLLNSFDYMLMNGATIKK
jgi:hypothetical protein